MIEKIPVASCISKLSLCLLFLFFSQNLFAQKNTKIGELKGVDFKFGFTGFDLSSNDATKIYSDIVMPDLEKLNITPTGFVNGQAANYCTSFYLGLVSKNKWFTKSKFLKNSENRFGIWLGNNSRSSYYPNYGAVSCEVRFDNDTTDHLITSMVKYIGYGIQADYIVNSKPIFKNFAGYMGCGANIILHNYKAYNKQGDLFGPKTPRFNSPVYKEMIHTKVSMSSIDLKLILGWKYNISCDFNYFMEVEFGGSFYNKGIFGSRKWLYVGNIAVLGIRYKFINPEEKTRSKANVFW
ncbi:MAG: hypothetical protein ACKVQB_06555 [Bacteroidia bacterium]